MSKGILSTKAEKREEIRRELGPRLVSADQVTPPAGLSTGWPPLDHYLLWKGYPKSSLSLMLSDAGGATSLWMRSAARVTQAGHWAAWISGPEAHLTPWSLRRAKVDLSKLLHVAPPADIKQLLWVMQELMSLCLFEMVGCDLGPIMPRDHHLLKLKKLAMRYETAIVLCSKQARRSSAYSLVLHFKNDHVVIDRALHRHTPHTLERRDLYADTLPLLAAGRRALGS